MSHGYSAFASISAARGATFAWTISRMVSRKSTNSCGTLYTSVIVCIAVMVVVGRVSPVATGSSVLPFARRRDPRVEVRPARPGEPVARTLDEAGFGPHVARLLGYPRDSPHGEILVAASGRGRLVGGACTASFGATGWIGALGVLPRARRHGVGELLTRAAVEWLTERGARTSLLYATDMGRRVYERCGFVAEAPA